MKAFNVKVLLGALLVFCVMAGGFTLWYHHQMKKLAAEDKAFKQLQEERNLTHPRAPIVPLRLSKTHSLLNASRNPATPSTCHRRPRNKPRRQRALLTRMPNVPRRSQRMSLCRLTASGPIRRCRQGGQPISGRANLRRMN